MNGKICLWCGNEFEEGMEGICRECWEQHQFSQNIIDEYGEEFHRCEDYKL